MPPAARITDMHVCPMVNPGPVPHVGGPIAMGAPTVFTGKLPQARVGDMAVCVGPPDSIVKGSSGVFVTKRPAARLGDNTAHGGVIVAGLPTVIIGETGGGGGGSGSVSAGVSSNGFVGGGLVAMASAQPPTMAESMKAAAAAGTPFCEICFKLTQASSKLVPQTVQPSSSPRAELRAPAPRSQEKTAPVSATKSLPPPATNPAAPSTPPVKAAPVSATPPVSPPRALQSSPPRNNLTAGAANAGGVDQILNAVSDVATDMTVAVVESVGDFVGRAASAGASFFGAADKTADVVVTVQKFLNTVSASNLAKLDILMGDSSPVDVKTVADDAINLPFMGVQNIGDVFEVAGSNPQSHRLFVEELVRQRARQRGLTYR